MITINKTINRNWMIGKTSRDKLQCTLYDDGSFIVSGDDDSEKYISWQHIPWREYKNDIETITFAKNTQIKSISNWFYKCENLIEVKNFPNGLTDMSIAFCGCKKMTSTPLIPDTVTDLDESFIDCIELTYVPIIPRSVIYSCDTFVRCKNLQGEMLIKPQLSQYVHMFQEASTNSGATLKINYTTSSLSVIDDVIATKSDDSNIVKGHLL